jgi:hypothetical protein
VADDLDELAYYRAVEDFFAGLRGRPHLLSPRDFQLLRGWWREGVPLAAVTGGLSEVFARRRDRGESDPVVSLSYCRHAIKRHARRLAEMRVGAESRPAPDGEPSGRSLEELDGALRQAAAAGASSRPEVATVIGGIVDRMEALAELPAAILEEHLFTLEAVLLEECWRVLPAAEREVIEHIAAAAAAEGTDEARERTRRAVRDRELRALLGLPRLELG